jgi:uncharacterized membrane protein (DUF4010 family)
MDLDVAVRLGLGFVIGAIVGAERGWQARQAPVGRRSAGVRTFAFVGLLGAVAALLADATNGVVLAAALLAVGLVVAVSYWLTSRDAEDVGMTTELSLLVTFGLGALAGFDYRSEAVGASIVVALALSYKEELHRSLARLERRELDATLQLLLIAAVVLPLLPDRDLGPWMALNPRRLGLLVLLIAAISYVGYFAVRLLGPRAGLLATAFLGGLTSSTAVTVAFARKAAQREAAPRLLGVAIALAAATMAPRLLVVIAVVNRSLVTSLLPALTALALVPLASALWFGRARTRDDAGAEVALRNPLDLRVALFYTALIAALLLLVRAVEESLGAGGVYALAAVSGLADVDAIGISLAHAAGGDLPERVAVNGIVLAALVNTASKAVLAALLGGVALGRSCGVILGGALVLAAALHHLLG